MDDGRFGAALRAVRLKRGWTQERVASRASVSRATVSRVERGQVGGMTVDVVRQISTALGIRVDLQPRWRGGELDRLVNARHAAMHEEMARRFALLPAWVMRPEVSFSIWGERGVIDVVAWHAGRRALLLIELKTELVDINDLMATADRRRRLSPKIAQNLGWNPRQVGIWIALAGSSSNARRVARYAAVLRSAFPADGRDLTRWLTTPDRPIAALSMVANVHPASAWRVGGEHRG